MYKNIMLKISGESLAGSNEQGFDFEILNDLSHSIKELTLFFGSVIKACPKRVFSFKNLFNLP